MRDNDRFEEASELSRAFLASLAAHNIPYRGDMPGFTHVAGEFDFPSTTAFDSVVHELLDAGAHSWCSSAVGYYPSAGVFRASVVYWVSSNSN